MESNTYTQKSFKLSAQEVKDIVVKHLIKSGHIKGDVDMSKIYMSDITKTEVEPGADPHDVYYYEVFNGIKITINE